MSNRERVVEGVATLERELRENPSLSQDTLVVMYRTAQGLREDCNRLGLPTNRLDQVQNAITGSMDKDARERVSAPLATGKAISGKEFLDTLKQTGGTVVSMNSGTAMQVPAQPSQVTLDPDVLPDVVFEVWVENIASLPEGFPVTYPNGTITISADEDDALDVWQAMSDADRADLFNQLQSIAGGATGTQQAATPQAPVAKSLAQCESCGSPIQPDALRCGDCGYEREGDATCEHTNKAIDEDTGMPTCQDCGFVFRPVVTHTDREQAINDLFGSLKL